MSVAEIGLLHGRYVRLTDRFKSMWTYHQFASGVFKSLLSAPLPYRIDFQNTYDRIKSASSTLNAAQVHEASSALGLCELALDRATTQLLRADDLVSASVLRRFFEKLKRQDEATVQFLLKFYLYADAVEGDHRDKLDFLFTRIGEHFVNERGDSWSRESAPDFRERIIALVSLLRVVDAPQEEVVRLIRAVRAIRDDIQSAEAFEELTERNLLKNARLFKHRLGDLYFHPDVLLAIVELNVATKNKFLKLYHDEERRIVDDAQKLMEHGGAIERNFGEKNPELVEEIARFREFKQRFDVSRADSNVKHDVVTQLKHSIGNILSQLDRGLGGDDLEASADLPASFFSEAERTENITSRFGPDPVLRRFLLRIASVVDLADPGVMPEEVAEFPNIKELRLEPWEIAAYQKLFERREPEAEEDNDELWVLYLRAAALRIKVDEEATMLAASIGAGVSPENDLLARAKGSLDCGKELDESFNDFLHEAVYYSNPKILHQLYRSRFRLLRGFSGLWLIYDRGGQPLTSS
ncbi:MAG: hypothetical protein DMF57_18735 [Acidobacteria bacterium]|nr:MAG: hypothetical protein DMF57_18735 [Acidobacteriota bacterium]